MQAEVPVVPIVCSSYFGQVDLNRWDNGEVLLEMLPPCAARSTAPPDPRELSDTCREKMEAKLVELDGKLGHRPAA